MRGATKVEPPVPVILKEQTDMKQVGIFKLYSIEEALDRHFGPVGTPKRDTHEERGLPKQSTHTSWAR